MRAAAFLAGMLLAGCDSAEPDVIAGTRDNGVDCRIREAVEFERVCSVEVAEGAGGRILTIRKPDGGFRRLLITRDGSGVAAADGAEPARVAIIDDGRIEVEIGGDRFRLPARIRR